LGFNEAYNTLCKLMNKSSSPFFFPKVSSTVSSALYSGRTQKEKDRLAEAITEDVVNILKVEKKDVIVVFQEAPHGNWYASGVCL
jgi:4-oxalocrotonate tautomerase